MLLLLFWRVFQASSRVGLYGSGLGRFRASCSVDIADASAISVTLV